MDLNYEYVVVAFLLKFKYPIKLIIQNETMFKVFAISKEMCALLSLIFKTIICVHYGQLHEKYQSQKSKLCVR